MQGVQCEGSSIHGTATSGNATARNMPEMRGRTTLLDMAGQLFLWRQSPVARLSCDYVNSVQYKNDAWRYVTFSSTAAAELEPVNPVAPVAQMTAWASPIAFSRTLRAHPCKRVGWCV